MKWPTAMVCCVAMLCLTVAGVVFMVMRSTLTQTAGKVTVGARVVEWGPQP